MFNRVKTPFLAALGLLALILAAVIWWVASPSTSETNALNNHAATVETRTLRLGLNIAADSALHAAAVRFADQVAERSKGKIKVSVHPNQELGSDDQMLEMARQGTLDLLLTPTAKLSSAIPAMQYADLPFYFSGRDELYAMLDGEPGQMLLAKLNAVDLVGLTFWENGFKQFTANTPIRRPEDFAKLRIRTMKSRIIADQFESLEARAIPIDFHATYQALADGAVDGQENPLVAIVGMRFHEVQKHLTLSNHAYLGYVFSASRRVFETLSPEIRDIILQTARELTVWEREETARREATLIDTIRQAGVIIHSLTPEEHQRFAQVMAPLADKFGFEVGYDLLAKTNELRLAKQAAQSAASSKKPLLIGIDADLSVVSAQAGGAIYRGVELAVEEINRSGGLLGAPVQILARDNKANPQVGRQNLEYFAAQPGLLGVFSGVFSGIHSAVVMEALADIHRLKIPFLVPWAAAQGVTRHEYSPNYVFRVSINDTDVAPFLLEKALKQGGPVTVLLERSAWGRSNEAALKPMLEKLGTERVDIEWINIGEPNLSNTLEASIDRLMLKGSHALVLVANGPECQHVVQAMARQEKPIPIFSHWGLTATDFWKQAQGALQRVDLRFVQTVLVDESAASPHLNKFIERYRARYGVDRKDILPSLAGSVHAYDLTHLLARAVKQGKSTEREAIRAALENLAPYSGLLRDYNPAFTKDRHDALDRSILHLARFDSRGRIVLAE
jgi:tripartite ATP-independent transporter DctP family solute receptor